MTTRLGTSLPACPFCGYEALEYGMLLHMEQQHAEGSSPFVVKGPPSSASADAGRLRHDEEHDAQYADCPVEGCGEAILAAEMAYHLDLHAQEESPDDAVIAEGTGAFQLANDIGPATSPAPRSKLGQDHPPEPPQQSQLQQKQSDHSHRHHHRHRRHENERDDAGRHRRQSEDSSSRARSATRRSALQAWRAFLNMPSPSATSSSRRHQHGQDGRGSGKSSTTATPEAPASSNCVVNPASPSTQSQRQRLGKAELGKYAHEQTMPDWLVAHLRNGGEVKAEGILPVVRQLLKQSPSTKYAYLCHPSVTHVSKLKKEGGFCGYRNIQMMVSYINAVQLTGAHHFENKLPSVFKIQDMIEDAWDKGINAQGRIETGGVRGTRKYIGTPEAQAVFCGLGIPCEAQGFKNREPGKSEARLLQDVEQYFQSGEFDPDRKVRQTDLPPIYFQHAGHSMTIVGIEKLKGGGTNLVVFDPMFRDSSAIVKLVGREFNHRFPDLALKPYRRGNKYLKKYREFEVLRLRPPAETRSAS